MGKEVENLISENTELLATKYVKILKYNIDKCHIYFLLNIFSIRFV